MQNVPAAQKSIFFDQPISPDDVLSAFPCHEEWLTRREIAQRIGRSLSPTLVALINGLVQDGRLRVHEGANKQGFTKYYYTSTQPC